MRWMGLTSALVLLLTWAALDDITTDNAQTFVFEYTLLVLAGAWFAFTAAWLIVRRHRVLGLASLAAIAIGIAAFSSLPRKGEPATAIDLLGWIPIAWFLALTVWQLAARGYQWVAATREPAAGAGDFRVPRRG